MTSAQTAPDPRKDAPPGALTDPRRLARLLAFAWFWLSLGGLLLHLRIHPVQDSLFHWIPAIVGAVNTFVLPLLFLRRDLAPYAVLAAWFTVVIGTMGMAWFSLTTWFEPVTFTTVILHSTFADIAILWAKIPLAYVILSLVRPEGPREALRGCARNAADATARHPAMAKGGGA